ncbi:hypothetical protein H9Q74_005759 [Fusarium xylarioides]|nr:hypothetical protein H9Q71_009297 [Fusarium xylarioides]KAG5824126.1 hypothetical protein H9Q74_005759 [Fusarium xylarioides]
MKPVATSPEQLTSQVHRLSFASPRLEDAGCLAPGEDVNRSYPAMFVTTDARSAASPIAPSIPQEDKCCQLYQTAECPPFALPRGLAKRGFVSHYGFPGRQRPSVNVESKYRLPTVSKNKTSHLLRDISQAPILHHYRLQRNRINLPSRLSSPSRPTLADLIARSIFMTHTSIVSRKLARSLVSIRLSRRLAARPSAAALVERSVLPKECVPGMTSVHVAPAIVAKKKAIEKERVKDGLRQWIASRWKREVKERQDGVRKWEESRGIGRVWRLRRFWERVSRGEERDSAW